MRKVLKKMFSKMFQNPDISVSYDFVCPYYKFYTQKNVNMFVPVPNASCSLFNCKVKYRKKQSHLQYFFRRKLTFRILTY